MANIGNFGKFITFKVNSKKILTFNNLSIQVSGRWNEHSIIGRTPKLEFGGPQLQTMSLEIYLSAELGVKPRATIEKLEKVVKKGKHAPFILNGKKIGGNEWVITDMSEAWECIFSKGELVSAKLNISMKEYKP